MAKKAHKLWMLPLLIFLSGCPTRQEIKANMWLNSGLPKELCDKLPELKAYGMYRKLNNGTYELQAYCNPQAQNYFSVHKDTLEKMLDAYLPKGAK